MSASLDKGESVETILIGEMPEFKFVKRDEDDPDFKRFVGAYQAITHPIAMAMFAAYRCWKWWKER